MHRRDLTKRDVSGELERASASHNMRQYDGWEIELCGLQGLKEVASEEQTDHTIRPADADILTIACDAQAMLSASERFQQQSWIIVHAGTTNEALACIRYNLAAVALVQAQDNWAELADALTALRTPPELIIISPEGLACGEALRYSGYNVVVPRIDDRSLFWAVSSARDSWLSRRQNVKRGALWFDA
jgi:hypothetical protein